MADIRTDLPVAVKTGTTHKPAWSIGEKPFKFIAPLNKAGLASDGKKPRLGKRILAKYTAGMTAAGQPLMFVGVFAEVK